jgi:Na+/H+ antiporter NhaD/arsenite permease-like protein
MSSFATVAAAVIFVATYLIVAIGFWEYFKVGAPLTLATLLIGLAWL